MRKSTLVPLLLAAGTWTACDEVTLAFGDVNSIIVAADPLIWASVENQLVGEIETTVFTVREEKTFKVTYQNPNEQNWARLRIFKQELLIGTANDPWMAEALDRVDEPLSPPQLLQTGDVWARGQTVTLVLLPEDHGPEDVQQLIPEVAELYRTQYREWVVNRMFVSGRDTALADTLRREAGFHLLVPEVYDKIVMDSVYLFRNDNPDPSELIRQIAITWRTPPPENFRPEDMLAWREDIVDRYYNYPQVVELDRQITSGGPVNGRPTYNLQAVWTNPPDEWPAAGPFKTRAIECENQNRLYLMDAWLYAPGEEKYEYMIQLEEIMDSFDCVSSR